MNTKLAIWSGTTLLLGGLLFAFSFHSQAFGATTLFPSGGGTGSTTLTGIIVGNGTSPVNTLTIGTNLTLTGTTLNASGGGSGASTTLLTDNNTFSGTNQFSGAMRSSSSFTFYADNTFSTPYGGLSSPSADHYSFDGTSFSAILNLGSLTADRTYTLFDGTGTLCLAGVNCPATTTANTWSALNVFANATTTLLSGSKAWFTNFIGSLTGNADTATALAANGTNCSAGNYPLGVDAGGNSEDCTAAGTGSVTSIATNNGITGGTITTSGTLSLDTTYGAVWTPASTTYTQHLSLNNASSTFFTFGNGWITGPAASSLLALDANNKLIASTTIGTNLLGGTLLAAQFPALTGDITTSAGNLATTLKNTGTAGTYRSVTFDAQGRETSGTNPTTFSGYAISDNSAGLLGALSDETGTGVAVFNTIPTLAGFLSTASSTITSGLFSMNGGASTTNLTVSTAFWNSGITSALGLYDANHKETAYAGSAPCTNQVALSISATGVITCTSITDAMFSGQLVLSHGGTNASLTGANQMLFLNAANNAVTNSANLTYLLAQGSLLNGTTTALFGREIIGTSTAPQLFLSDNSAGNMWSLRNAGGSLFIATSTASATSTVAAMFLDANGFINMPSIKSAVITADSTGKFTAATTQTCTNQFVRAMSAAYAATCASVANTDLTNSSINFTLNGILGGSSVALGGTETLTAKVSTSSSPTVGRLAYWTSNGTPNLLGDVATSSETCTSPITCAAHDVLAGGGAITLGSVSQYLKFTYSTSTTWTGTTTLQLGPAFVAETWASVICYTNAGTLNVQFSQNALAMNMFNASTTMGTTTLSTNNSVTAGAQTSVAIGTPASSPVSISCALKRTYSIN